MSLPLAQILSEVSVAVQQANKYIDSYTAESYIEQGYNYIDSNQDKTLQPKTYKIIMPNNKEELNVPQTILMNHKSIQLDEIDFKLKIALVEDENNDNDGQLLANIAPSNENSNFISEINLHFKSTPTPEGTARIQSKYLQDL